MGNYVALPLGGLKETAVFILSDLWYVVIDNYVDLTKTHH